MRFDVRVPVAISLLLAVTAGAQPAGRLGLYATVGSAAPERSLFRDAADPVLTLGYRFSDAFDVQLGARLDTDHQLLGSSASNALRNSHGLPSVSGESTRRTKALVSGLGLNATEGGARFSLRTSVGIDAYDRTTTLNTYIESPDDRTGTDDVTTDVEAVSATFAHLGASGIVALPIRRESARLTPGLGLAVATARRLSGSVTAPPARAMAFLSVPTRVDVGPVGVTLDARVGMARPLEARAFQTERWSPVVEAGIRLDV